MQTSRLKLIKIELYCYRRHQTFFQIIHLIKKKSQFRGRFVNYFKPFRHHLLSTVIRRTSGQSLGNFQQNDAVSPSPQYSVSVFHRISLSSTLLLYFIDSLALFIFLPGDAFLRPQPECVHRLCEAGSLNSNTG
jgi:hypothetical protein